MRRRLIDIWCVFRIHLERVRAEAGPFILAALLFPAGMYLFAAAVGGQAGGTVDRRLQFLAGSIVFSLSLTAITWVGYLLLENRFMGRLRLFATLPLALSSYALGILLFGVIQAAVGVSSLLLVSRVLGVHTALTLTTAGLLAVPIVLMMLCGCGLAFVIASHARSMSEGSLMTDALGAGLVLIPPIYYGPEALPRVFQYLSRLLPTTYAARAVQATLAGRVDVMNDLSMLAVMAFIALAIGMRSMRWTED
jgi:ABC-type multidrug transport system permease subunit